MPILTFSYNNGIITNDFLFQRYFIIKGAILSFHYLRRPIHITNDNIILNLKQNLYICYVA